MTRVLLAALCAALALPVAGLFAQAGGIERYALLVGSNVGGKSTANLRYATNDARRMSEILVRIGGTPEENMMLLVNPERESLANGLAFMGAKIRKSRNPGASRQFVFYYSGHSDERGLLLYGEYFDYGELRDALASLEAEVRVVILDSCSSGSFTRDKGGTMAPPFLMDESTSVEGHAYITSSSAEELSQESDKIESSFFTHFLLNGLRGAADSNGDGKVTLNEAYEYAYDRTLSETERTRSGAQHPAFDIKLNGMGNLVLTDLRDGEAVLKLPKGLVGRLSLRDVSDKLVLEVRKTEPKEMLIGVEQGYYRMLLEEGSSIYETVLIVDERREYEIRRDAFREIAAALGRIRGPSVRPVSLVPIGLKFRAEKGGSSVYLNLLGGKTDSVNGFMASLLFNSTVAKSSGYQGSLFANVAGADFYGVQLSLGTNVARGDFFGLQASALINVAGGNLKGLQVAAHNRAEANVKFGQIGAWNVAAGGGEYFQLGTLNRSSSSINGAQVGAINLGKRVVGMQLGVFNYSETQDGVQIGLVNVSKNLKGFPVGLIDIQLNGENHMDIVFHTPASRFDDIDDSLFATAYFRFGSRYFYKYFDFGARTMGGSTPRGYPYFIAGAGLGFRIPILFEGFALHIDGGANYQSAVQTVELVADPSFLHKIVPQARLFASCKVFRNSGFLTGVQAWVYTKYFHEMPAGADELFVRTEYGLLYADATFFVGLQL
jgi:hypothetical protein